MHIHGDNLKYFTLTTPQKKYINIFKDQYFLKLLLFAITHSYYHFIYEPQAPK